MLFRKQMKRAGIGVALVALALSMAGCGGAENQAPPAARSEAGQTTQRAVEKAINLAPLAQVAASSEFKEYGRFGADQVKDEGAGEWASAGEKAGAWVKLSWDFPVIAQRVELEDRPNPQERVTAGHLAFSDSASTVAVQTLPDEGIPLSIAFTPRRIRWIRFVVESVSTGTINIGLRRFRVFGAKAEPLGASAKTP